MLWHFSVHFYVWNRCFGHSSIEIFERVDMHRSSLSKIYPRYHSLSPFFALLLQPGRPIMDRVAQPRIRVDYAGHYPMALSAFNAVCDRIHFQSSRYQCYLVHFNHLLLLTRRRTTLLRPIHSSLVGRECHVQGEGVRRGLHGFIPLFSRSAPSGRSFHFILPKQTALFV
jgi:hypothetical protein